MAGHSSYDVIVIGAGSAGSVIAGELARETNWRILLLEAGGKNESFFIQMPLGYGKSFTDPKVNWMFSSSPDGSLDNKPLYLPRGKGLGGSSAINAMVYTRSFRSDYDDWGMDEWNGETMWRSFDALENRDEESPQNRQYVAQLGDKFHPLSRYFLQAASELDLPQTDMVMPDAGVGDYQFTIKNGRRQSAAKAFLRKEPNLHVLTHAEVSRIVTENRRARFVEFRQRGKRKRAEAKGLVILCAGAYQSPKILQNSGIGNGEWLQNLGVDMVHHNAHIGANLQDHLAISYHFKSSEPSMNAVLGSFWGRMGAGAQYLFARQGPLARSMNEVGGFVRSSPSRSVPDFQLYFNPISFDRNDAQLREKFYPPHENGFVLCFQPCRPTSLGDVKLRSSDPFDNPMIMPNYLSTEKDQNDVLLGANIIRNFVRTMNMASINAGAMGFDLQNASAQEIYDDFCARAGTVFHPCGSLRMAAHENYGAVDEGLNLYGVTGLKVVDASVFPNITSGNTNAPVMALALEASKRIREELR